MSLTGLTSAQVEKRVRAGKINRTDAKAQNTVGKIILTNTLTIFNLVNLILALMIISVGAYKNLLFILVAIANTGISIINSIRAKKTIDRMRLRSEQHPTVIRDGEIRQIPSSQLVEDDLLILSLGDQIPVDAKIEEGQIEVNESFITGEQDNITKTRGDQLTSGSFIVSGTCKATATAVGQASQLAKIESSAHTIKTADSKLFSLINNIVKYVSFALIPIGALLLWARFNVPDTTPEVAVTSTVAGLISMIPEGLVLLTSSVLALATIRLSRQKVLVQDLYSVETLARVDTICLDKTGTLTTGKMTVHDFVPAPGQSKNTLQNALALILSSQDADNATSTALKAKLLKTPSKRPTEPITEVIPFSSDRKYSGVKTKTATYLMGAPEFILKRQPLPDFPSKYRIIAVTKNQQLLGYALLEDEIRRDAKNIINYFYDNDIDVKIISGDNLQTVTTIAETVGVRTAKGVDLSTVKTKDYSKLVQEYNIFTRVKPAQKKQLVQALKKQGRTVAMTGDGVNDILAMKESDCSIAIGEGSDAARRSAKLVLLGSDFASVPSVINEGRQSINNLERSATLFLSKNTYAAILAVLFIIIPLQSPYAPLEMSLLNFACIGLPGIILALEKNTARIKNQFVKNILQFSVPTGITVAVAMLALAILADNFNFTRAELITTSAVVTFAIDFLLMFSIARPLNPLKSTLLVISLSIITLALAVPFFRDFLDFTLLDPGKATIAALLIAASYAVFGALRLLSQRLTPKFLQKFRI